MSLLCEITELMQSMPHPATPPDVVADWYTRKAELLDAIAAADLTSPRQAADATECATKARAHAAELRARYSAGEAR